MTRRERELVKALEAMLPMLRDNAVPMESRLSNVALAVEVALEQAEKPMRRGRPKSSVFALEPQPELAKALDAIMGDKATP